jgi:hypothetical protein
VPIADTAQCRHRARRRFRPRAARRSDGTALLPARPRCRREAESWLKVAFERKGAEVVQR